MKKIIGKGLAILIVLAAFAVLGIGISMLGLIVKIIVRLFDFGFNIL